MKKWTISVCGCSLVDRLYTNFDFSSPAFMKFRSRRQGDGGIAAGQLVFAEDLEAFSGMKYDAALCELTNGAEPDASNLGGPAIVGAINASQILFDLPVSVAFYGTFGKDSAGDFVKTLLSKTDIDTVHYRQIPGPTPVTDVLSDPSFHQGKGERSFVNRMGVASLMTVNDLDDDFFRGDVLWFAATALVPDLHDHLHELLRRGHRLGKINVVSTVFDFRNEKKDPVGPWPLGASRETYRDIDLLIMDRDEALRMSGTADIQNAARFFIDAGVSAFFITYGAKNFYAWSDGRLFLSSGGKVYDLPVSELVDRDLAEHPERKGDTTGCGDNFAGGLVASLVMQLCNEEKKAGELSLLEAASWATASGGAACFQIGGTWIEKEKGEKYRILARYADAYAKAVSEFSI